MVNMPDQYLLEFNKQGFVPGPDEDEKEYQQRITEAMNISRCIKHEDVPFRAEDSIPAEHKKEGLKITKELFDISPQWAPAFYHNHALAPWHAANSWIISENNKHTTSLIQLRKQFSTKPAFLHLYHRDEVMAHELAHVGRCQFKDSKYEEIIAYTTSKTKLRRYLGPLLSSVIEAWVFLISILLVLIVDMIFFAMPKFSWIPFIEILQLLPWAIFSGLLIRLGWRHYTYHRCLKKICAILDSSKKARSVLYRLTDKEISLFSRTSISKIKKYILNNKTLRWRVLCLAYFSHIT